MDVQMDRKEFLFVLASEAVAITGWVLLPGCAREVSTEQQDRGRFCPALSADIQYRSTADGGELFRSSEQGERQVVCQVNPAGANLIAQMNGRQTIQEITQTLYKEYTPEQIERGQASVASFLAVLAQAELLATPFFVNIHVAEITA